MYIIYIWDMGLQTPSGLFCYLWIIIMSIGI